jgi:hypothetical protein
MKFSGAMMSGLNGVQRDNVATKGKKRKALYGMSIAISDSNINRIMKSNLMDIEQHYGRRKK